jgi:hypothetical protein
MFSPAAVAPAGATPLLAAAPAADAGDVAGPRLLRFRVLGSPYGVTGIRLEFDEPLASGPAQRQENYVLRGDFTSRDTGSERSVDSEGNLSVGDRTVDEIGIAGATYDDAARLVTLRRERGFLLSHLRTLHVRSGPDGLRDPAGNFFDGDDDGQAGGVGVLRFRTTWGRRVTFFDADGDRVRLQLSGPGRLFVFRQISKGGEGRRKGNAVQVWIADSTSMETSLSGTVNPSARGGDGQTSIGEILSVDEAQVKLLSDPRFQVGAVIP